MKRFNITIDVLASVVKGHLTGAEGGAEVIDTIATDTRQLSSGNVAFIALRGPNHDGNSFVSEAVEKGASVVVVSDRQAIPESVPAILVEDGLVALQTLAAWWRDQFEGQLVVIVGSNGKTVVKEMANDILAPVRRVCRSPRSYNSQVGVALSLLLLEADADVALIECGVGQPGEMNVLRKMVRPDIGVFTYMGKAHLAGFGTRSRICTEKLLMFDGFSGRLVMHDSVRPFQAELESFLETNDEPPVITWVGTSESSDLCVTRVERVIDGIAMTLSQPLEENLNIRLQSYAEHDAGNAACAAALGRIVGVSDDRIKDGLESFQPEPMRIEVHTSESGITLINDSYSSDPLSSASALHTLARLAKGRRSIAVLGSMRELGEASKREHRDIGRQVAELDIDYLITVGEDARAIATGALEAGFPPERIRTSNDNAECAAHLERVTTSDDVVLVKASRPLRLEWTAESLLEAVSPTRVYIDLQAIADNVRRVRDWIGPRVALFAVVKSFGYGSDAVRVSEMLELQGIDYLYVAYPDEGAALRRRGIQTPILVGNILPDETDKLAKWGMSAVAATVGLIDRLNESAIQMGTHIPVHVKVDTGMSRYGLEPDELVDFAELVAERPGLHLEGLMSHMSSSGDRTHDAFSLRQIDLFEQAATQLKAAGVCPKFLHLANSAGLIRFPQAHFSAVRIGLGLYGCLDADRGPVGSPALTPAISLHSRLVNIREIEKGRAVGYMRSFKTKKRTRVGLVALGYNDGLPWTLSNRGMMWIRGSRAPIVGRVCMDVTMVDLTDIPAAQIGDDVVIYGSGEEGEPTVADVAELAGTIPYEILCRLSPRVQRIIRLAD